MIDFEKFANPDGFYLGYLSIIDFFIHEIFQYYKSIFHKEVHLFPKLIAIRERVASIECICKFEKSERTVECLCPLDFYRKWKLETMRPWSKLEHKLIYIFVFILLSPPHQKNMPYSSDIIHIHNIIKKLNNMLTINPIKIPNH